MILNALKIIILLGFLIFIHEFGHFLVAKLFKVKVKQFAIGFGPILLKKQGKETSYELRLIPIGGFVNLLGEDLPSDDENAYNKKSKTKRALILLAGGTVNILFGLILFFIIVSIAWGIKDGLYLTFDFLKSTISGLIELFTRQG